MFSMAVWKRPFWTASSSSRAQPFVLLLDERFGAPPFGDVLEDHHRTAAG
jgi:hypothetical protein